MNADENLRREKLPDPNEPFDVVYTWVNHADPDWQKLYGQASQGRVVPIGEHASADDPARYIDRGELYWSIRSVHKYAPWVRHIHIVTNCTLPGWAEAMPDVSLVRHEEIFPDAACLPTFNSHAIETSLHRIDGLSKRFLYFNDDVFLCREVMAEDFFWGSEGVYYTLSAHDIPYSRVASDLRPVDVAAIHAANLLERDFGLHPIKKLQHAPHALSRAILREINEWYADEANLTRSHPFRYQADLPIATTMHAYYAQCTSRGKPGTLRTRYIDIGDWRFLGLIHPAAPLLRGKYDTLCLNEVQTMRHGRWLRDTIVRRLMRRMFA